MVVYGGNSAVRLEAQQLLEAAGFSVRVTSNVYPGIDELDIVPARHVIHDAFEEHIIHAPGMGSISELVSGAYPAHARCRPHRRRETRRDPRRPRRGRRGRRDDRRALDHRRQPRDRAADDRAAAAQQAHGRRRPRHVRERLARGRAHRSATSGPTHLPPALPATETEVDAAVALARAATVTGVHRHAGQLAHLYTPSGRQTIARGRDLTACRLLIGTGGALTRLPKGIEHLQGARGTSGGDRLLPPSDATCVLDRAYIFACCGALLGSFRRRCRRRADAPEHRTVRATTMIGDRRMLEQATLTIDLAKIEENARRVCAALPGVRGGRRHQGDLRGRLRSHARCSPAAFEALGESRLENIERHEGRGHHGSVLAAALRTSRRLPRRSCG